MIYTVNNSSGITRTDPYFKFDNAAAGDILKASMDGAVAPVIPFKAFCSIVGNVADGTYTVALNPSNFSQNFNVKSYIVSTSSPNTIYTINFVNKIDNQAPASSSKYIVLATTDVFSGSDKNVFYTNTKNDSLQIICTTVVDAANRPPFVSFGVIQY